MESQLKKGRKLSGLLNGRVIDFLESPSIPLINFILTFFSCVMIRNFVEAFSQATYNMMDYPSVILSQVVLHYTASYIMVANMIILALHYITKVPVINILKVVFAGGIVLLVTPIVDLIASHGAGHDITYFLPEEDSSLLHAYLTYFYFGNVAGASIGIKVEVAIILLGVYCYVHHKTRNFMLSLGSCWLVYTIIFFYGAMPFLTKGFADIFGLSYDEFTKQEYAITYFFVADFFLAAWLIYLSNKKTLLALFGEIPHPRILHYQVMFIIGIYIALSKSFYTVSFQLQSNPLILLHAVLLMIAIFFSLLFAMVINNLADIEIDKVSNPARALVRGMISMDGYSRIAYISMFLSFIYALLVAVQGMFVLAVIMGAYYVYSAYPLRLKRVPVLSKIVIAGNSLALILLGFWVVHQNLNDFPVIMFPLVLIGMTLAANFIDLKDVEGDRAEGIKTLPVLVGMLPAQWFCGAAFFACYLSVGLVFESKVILSGAILGGLLQIYLLTRRPYKERPIFIVYFASLLFLMWALRV